MNYSVVHVNKMVYEHREVVKLEFSYSEELVKLVKSLPGARWDQLYRMWYIEKRAGLLNEVLSCFKGKAYLDYRSLKNEAVLVAPPEEKKEVSHEPVVKSVYNNKIIQPVKPLNKKQSSRAKQYALFI